MSAASYDNQKIYLRFDLSGEIAHGTFLLQLNARSLV